MSKKILLVLFFINFAVIGWAQNITVAVPDFTSRSYTNEDLAEFTILFSGFMRENDVVRVLTRRESEWKAITGEIRFQDESGLVDRTEVRKLGRALGAQAVVIGTIMKPGNSFILNVSVFDVETGEMTASARKQFRSPNEFNKIFPAVAKKVAKALKPKRPRPERSVYVRPGSETRLWSMGASVGTSFATPLMIGSVNATLAPFSYSFFNIGIDAGFLTVKPNRGPYESFFASNGEMSYYSLFPFAHCAFYLPIDYINGWYAGVGASYMIANYTFPQEDVSFNILAFEVITGLNIWDFFNISYALRTDFKRAGNKFTIGYFYRF